MDGRLFAKSDLNVFAPVRVHSDGRDFQFLGPAGRVPVVGSRVADQFFDTVKRSSFSRSNGAPAASPSPNWQCVVLSVKVSVPSFA